MADDYGEYTDEEYDITPFSFSCNASFPNHTGFGESFCEFFHDGIMCWFPTAINTTTSQPCPNRLSNDSQAQAYRYCPSNGTWAESLTNYSECLDINPFNPVLPIDPDILRRAEIVRDVSFILGLISLILLLITLFIFQYFRSLQCCRISIHKNLVVSFILRSIVIVITVQPYISRSTYSYRDVPWLCKTVTSLLQYTVLANTFWMFVEGLFLHNRLVVGVFNTEAPFKLFYFIGWGLPGTFIIAWAVTLHFMHDVKCWQGYSQIPYYYIITVPFLSALAVNLVFLVNIIRVLVSKLRANNRIESANIRKAIKATVVLLPLLGLTNLLFFMSPGRDSGLRTAYHVTNAVLQASQGIFVAVLYCFLNGEVRRVIKQKWFRFKIRHVLHRTGGRRRSSRTSSFFLSQTEDTDSNNPDRVRSHPAAEQLRMLQAELANNSINHYNADNSSSNNNNRSEGNGNNQSSNQTNRNSISNGPISNHTTIRFKLDLERETVL